MSNYNLGEARGKITIEYDGSWAAKAKRGIEEFKSTVESTRAGTEGMFRTLGGFKGIGDASLEVGKKLSLGITAPAVAAGTALGALTLGPGLQRLVAIDNAQAKLRGLGHDAGTVQTIMDNALASVKGTAYGLGDAATVAANAVAAGVAPGRDLERTLKLVADASTIAGVGMNEMGAIFNKAAASNKVQMDIINQLHDAGVPALALLARQMGVTAEEAAKMASEGKINFQTFQDAIESGMGGAALKSGETFVGAMANMRAAMGRFGAELLSQILPKVQDFFARVMNAFDRMKPLATEMGAAFGPIFERLVNGIASLIEAFASLDTQTQMTILAAIGVAAAVGPALMVAGKAFQGVEAIMLSGKRVKEGYAAATYGVRAATYAETTANKVGAAAYFLKVKALRAAAIAQAFFNKVILANPIVRIIAVIAAVIAILAALATQSEALRKAFEPVMQAMQRAGERLGPVFERIGEAFGRLVETITRSFLPIVEKGADLLARVLTPAFELLAKIVEVVMRAIEPLIDLLVAVLVPALDGVVWVLDRVTDGLDWFLTAVETLFKGLSGNLDDNGSEWSNWYYQGVKPIIDAFSNAMKPFTDAIVNGWEAIQDGVRPVVDWWVNDVWPNTVRGFQAMGDKAGEFTGYFITGWNKIIDTVAPIAQKVGGKVYDFVRDKAIEGATHVATFRDKFITAWEVLSQRLTPIRDTIGTAFDVIKGKAEELPGAAISVRDRFAQAWEDLQTRVSPITDWLGNTALPQVQNALSPIGDKAAEVRDKMIEAWGRIQESAEPIANRWNNEILPRLGEAHDKIKEKAGELGSKVVEAWTNIQTELAPITDSINRLVEKVGELMGRFFESGGDGKSSGPDEASQPVLSTWDKIMMGIDIAVTIIIAALDVLIGAIDGVTVAFETLAGYVSSTMMAVQTAVTIGTTTVSALFRGEWSRMPDIVKNAWQSMPQGVRDVLSNVYTVVSGIQRRIEGVFSDATMWLFNAGRNIIIGLRDGIVSMIGSVRSKLEELTNMIPDWKGPAERDRVLLYDNGKLIMQSLANGLASEIGDVYGLLNGLNTSIPATIQQDVMANVKTKDGKGQGAIHITVEYHAAPGDGTRTKEDIMGMLGQAAELVREKVA